MRHPLPWPVLLACLIPAAVLASDPAVDTSPTVRAQAVQTGAAPELTIAEREAMDLLRDLTIQRNGEIETELATGRLKVEELQARLAATNSPGEQLAIQRAVEAAKLDSQIAILRIQARYADLAGKPELATEIREQVQQFEQIAADRFPTPNR